MITTAYVMFWVGSWLENLEMSENRENNGKLINSQGIVRKKYGALCCEVLGKCQNFVVQGCGHL